MECVKHCQDINDYFNQKQNACWLRLVVIKSLLGKKEKKKSFDSKNCSALPSLHQFVKQKMLMLLKIPN